MSTRKPVPHPAQKAKHNKSHKKLPTMDKEGKFMNVLKEQNDQRQQITSSIANRASFLHNTAINNKRNEANRLLNTMAAGMQPIANDGRFRQLSNAEMQAAGLRVQSLQRDIRNTQPIIGTQGR